ncbi:uncharacterized protein LOC130741196 isoform X2 [Lotus japonicus]|uniref:uncharacterized protein LOC130741196 isoform X2 n=1 Tax=Lotus japonicus TaxID=34305 RepID=UPI002584EAB7|nr:uncharacterized protein LOC130741196 isoform X2 [Lotus japonicus]
MDVLVKFPIRASSFHCPVINSDITKKLALRFSSTPSKRICNLQSIGFNRNVLKKPWDRKRISAIAPNRDPKSEQNSFSPAEIVDHFYTCINDKELRKLDECISQDACFDDYTFIKPFQGKKEVMHFLQQLTDSMGQNVKFRTRKILEGDDLTVAANWHLEWKKEQIPLTRGCSFFKLSKEGEIMIIRAEVLIESPVKPGSIVLTVLKTVTSLFDAFPNAAEWFLRKPHAILTWILKIYSIFIEPMVKPLLDGYIKLWGFTVRLLIDAFKLLAFISKILFK